MISKTSKSLFGYGYKSLCLLILTTSLPSHALEIGEIQNFHTQDSPAISSIYQTSENLTEFFKPNPTLSTQLDFKIWDDWLKLNIVFMGPSIRRLAPSALSPAAGSIGSRFIDGHRSRYRYEGTKIPYRTMRKPHQEFVALYQNDLERLSEEIDITALPRNDQLSYWFNLHNVALINQINSHYPTKFPDKIKPIDGSLDKLHDAKILKVMGQYLSLRDIREKIVYQHWQDSIVIYGFHHGNLGGPNIALSAYDRNNVQQVLTFNAGDFVNSFRGFRDGKISPIYRDASPFYFPTGEKSIRVHLKRFMRPELFTELSTYDNLKWHKPISDIADLSGGRPRTGLPTLVTNGSREGINTLTPRYALEYTQALITNVNVAKERGWLANGQVTIEDIETTDPDQISEEVK